MVSPAPHSGQPLSHDEINPRLAKVAGLETILLVARYFLVVLYGGLLYKDMAPFDGMGMLTLAVPYLLHNGIVHVIAYTRLHRLYLHRANLFVHIVQCTILVTLTGAENSPFTILYVFVLLAQMVYAPHFRHINAVIFACAAAFIAAAFAHAIVFETTPSWLPLIVTLSGLIFCYGLIRSLANLLYTIELSLQTRAQELASSKATLRTILDSAGGPIIVYDNNEFITESNARACEFFKRSRKQLLGMRFRQFFFDDGTLSGKLATLSARGEYQGELLAVLPEGDEFNVSISIRSFIREGQRYFVVLLHNVTEQKQLQEATRNANFRLEQINRELQEVDALRNAFFGAVSQRLRSPLSAILGHTNLLLDEELGDLNAEQRKALQSCRRSVVRVFGLVDEAFEDQDGTSIGVSLGQRASNSPALNPTQQEEIPAPQNVSTGH
jgi:PAS domain S-box-containing protein